MRKLILAPLALLLLLTMAAGCDGDEALTLEEYFQRMTDLDSQFDDRFDEVFGAEDASARSLTDSFVSAANDYRGELDKIDPPSEVEQPHNDLSGAIGEAVDAVEEAGKDLTEDDPPDAFEEALFSDENSAVGDAFERVDGLFCDIQQVADDKGIEADVGCEEDGGEDPRGAAPEETNEVLMQDLEFQPIHVQVQAGDTVTWTQGTDTEGHTVTSDDNGETFQSDILSDEGETFEFTFEEPGEFVYFCEVHPEMVGVVTVVQ